jgi:hypothetical protein
LAKRYSSLNAAREQIGLPALAVQLIVLVAGTGGIHSPRFRETRFVSCSDERIMMKWFLSINLNGAGRGGAG